MILPCGAIVGVCGVLVDFGVPAELSEPGVVVGVDFCEFALGEGDFAVVGEAVGVNGQVAFRLRGAEPIIHPGPLGRPLDVCAEIGVHQLSRLRRI